MPSFNERFGKHLDRIAAGVQTGENVKAGLMQVDRALSLAAALTGRYVPTASDGFADLQTLQHRANELRRTATGRWPLNAPAGPVLTPDTFAPEHPNAGWRQGALARNGSLSVRLIGWLGREAATPDDRWLSRLHGRDGMPGLLAELAGNGPMLDVVLEQLVHLQGRNAAPALQVAVEAVAAATRAAPKVLPDHIDANGSPVTATSHTAKAGAANSTYSTGMPPRRHGVPSSTIPNTGAGSTAAGATHGDREGAPAVARR